MKIQFEKTKRNTKNRNGHIQIFKYKDLTFKRVIKAFGKQKKRMYLIYLNKKLLHKTPDKNRLQPLFNLLTSNY